MNDKDQNPEEKVSAAEPAPVEGVSMQPSAETPPLEVPLMHLSQTAPQAPPRA